MKYILRILCISIFLIACTGCGSNPHSDQSVAFAAHELADKKRELDRLRLQLNQMRNYNSNFVSLKSRMARSYDLNEYQRRIQTDFVQLQKKVEFLKKEKAPKNPEANQLLKQPLMEADWVSNELEDAISDSIANVYRAEAQISALNLKIEASYNTAISPIDTQPFTPSSDLDYLQPKPAFRYGSSSNIKRLFPTMYDVLTQIRNARDSTENPPAERLQSASAEITDLSKSIDPITNRTQIQTTIDESQNKLQQFISKVENEITNNTTRQQELETILRTVDSNASQQWINTKLVFAVYGMIIIIGIVFAMLVYREDAIVSLLIKKRLLIEVLSMGFLLLTIIILGTGKMLNQEGLAALLGTIAGYIFGQKAAELAARRGGTRISKGSTFTFKPSSGTAPLTVQFTDGSTNNPSSWAWNFGDGTTATTQNPNHTYANPGTYSVTLTATSANGNNIQTLTGNITVNMPLPVAAFSALPLGGPHTTTAINFADSSTNSPTSWLWDFGDGTTAITQNPTHTYGAPGTYTVKLTVTNASGSDTLQKIAYITVT